MADRSDLGADLDLGLVADEEGRVFAGPPTQMDLQTGPRPRATPRQDDLRIVEGQANLVQALILRLQTEHGELAELGHPEYGSRHHRLVGEPNTESNRNLVKLYILECLKQEPRLEQVLSIEVKAGPGRENRDKVDVSIRVKMRSVPSPLSLVVPFTFEPLEAAP